MIIVRSRLTKLIENDSAQLKMNARRHELMYVLGQMRVADGVADERENRRAHTERRS